MAETNGKNGAGSLFVKSLNGAGLLALLAAVAVGGLRWGDLDDLQEDFTGHCESQVTTEKDQAQIDKQQDATVRMMNEAMLRIDFNVQDIQKDMDELKSLLRERDL